MCWEQKTTASRKVPGGGGEGISSPRREQIPVFKATYRSSNTNFKVQEKKTDVKSAKKEIEEKLDLQET